MARRAAALHRLYPPAAPECHAVHTLPRAMHVRGRRQGPERAPQMQEVVPWGGMEGYTREEGPECSSGNDIVEGQEGGDTGVLGPGGWLHGLSVYPGADGVGGCCAFVDGRSCFHLNFSVPQFPPPC